MRFGLREVLLVLFLAAAVPIGGGIWLYSEATGKQSAAEQQSKSQSQAGDIEIQRECALLPAKEQPNCANEGRRAANQAKHDIADLEAQRVTAIWTHYMGVAAIVGTAFGLLGIILVMFTFWENRRAADTAEQTYRAFVAAEDAAIVIRFGGAVIHASHGGGPWHNDFSLNVAFENDGRSTARLGHAVYDGEEIPIDYPVEPGKRHEIAHMIHREGGEPFEFALHYSTPLRPAVVLTVTARPEPHHKASHKATGLILTRKVEFPT